MSISIMNILIWAKEKGYRFEYYGDRDIYIQGFSSLQHYKEGTITWIKKEQKDPSILIDITCAVVQEGIKNHPENCIVTNNSKELFFSFLEDFFSENEKRETIGSGTYIGENVLLDENVRIGCNCVLDGDIHIGEGSVIEHNVVITNKVSIGKECIIHSGSIIGKDGFGYSINDERIPQKVKHFGDIMIGNHVEIGANCVIDRGTIDTTIIDDDTKIDSLCIVAHNVIIGKGNLIVGCTNIGGSSRIGDKSYIGPKVCIRNQISIGTNSFVGMGTVLYESIDNDTVIPRPGLKPMKNKDYRRFL